ncbi:MAG: hypothetical protein AB7K37_04535 [Cyclobacteriaceae bacterium]
MIEEIAKAVSLVLLPSMLKFLFGPLAGKAAGLGLITTMIATAAGMMASVVAFTYFGEFLRTKILKYLKLGPKPDFNDRQNSSFFKKYGVAGIALLTPVILTPIGGTLLAVSATSNKKKILVYMLISACFWSVVITSAVYFGYDAILKFIKQIQPL